MIRPLNCGWFPLAVSLGWMVGGCTVPTPVALIAARPSDSVLPLVSESTRSLTLPSPYRQKRLTPVEADALMQAVIEAINRGQGNSLLPYLLDRDQREENMQAAIADYKAYFRGEAIAGFERKSIEPLGQLEQQPIQR